MLYATPGRDRRILALAAIAAIGMLLIGVGSATIPRSRTAQPPNGVPAVEPAPVVGAPAPDFELATPQGGTIRLRDLRGQAVLLNFWATWCGPCRAEMPTMQAIYEQNRERGFTIVAINLREQPEQVRSFMAELGLTFPGALDSAGAVADAYTAANIPTSFFIDKDGIIRARYFGPMSRAVMEASLEGVLP